MFTFNKNLNKTLTFVLCNLPLLKHYHQSAISWQPVEASRFKSKRLSQTDDNMLAICIFKLDSNHFQTFDNFAESSCTQSKSDWIVWGKVACAIEVSDILHGDIAIQRH